MQCAKRVQQCEILSVVLRDGSVERKRGILARVDRRSEGRTDQVGSGEPVATPEDDGEVGIAVPESKPMSSREDIMLALSTVVPTAFSVYWLFILI